MRKEPWGFTAGVISRLATDGGQTLAEYAFICALVVVVVVVAAALVGGDIYKLFLSAVNAFPS